MPQCLANGLLFLGLSISVLAQASSGVGKAEPCRGTVHFRWTGLSGDAIPVDRDEQRCGSCFLLVQSGKAQWKASLFKPLKTNCGTHEFTSFIPGGKYETFQLNVLPGVQYVSIGVTVGWLRPPELLPASGVWPNASSLCPDPFVRAVPVYGQGLPVFGELGEGSQFTFRDIHPGKYALVLVSKTGDCPVPPRLVTVDQRSVRFDDGIGRTERPQ